MFALRDRKTTNPMCKHQYVLVKTKIVRLGTHFSKKQVATEHYQCRSCGKKTYIKKEIMMDMFELPPLTILQHLN